MLVAFAYRLYPSRAQRNRLESITETCRRFYNACLAERKDASEQRSETIGTVAQLRKVKELKATNPYAVDIHSHVLQVAVADLDKAFQAFFRRAKAGEKPGSPRFKGRNRFSGFGFKEHGNGFKLDGRRLKLSGIGRVAVRWHRPIEGTIKTCRIVRRAGTWFVRFACEVEKPEPLPETGRRIGVDVGLHRLATLSDGQEVENPRWYRTAQRKIRIAQRRVARRKLGGSNRRKAVRQLQRLMLRVANTRKDFLEKLSTDWIRRFDAIVLEDLRVAAMARGHFAKSILDAGWSSLVARLTSKAACAGRAVILVEPASTSKTCSGCGVVFEHLRLSDRRVSCGCGVRIDRDHNAAINILNRGLGQSPWASSSPAGGLAQEAAAL